MLVEDNPADVDLIEEALTEGRIDCELDVIQDGDKAIAAIERADADTVSRCPDLILLDLNLPKVSGEEVLKRVRASRRFRNIKVLIVSSSNAPSDRERAMQLGATDYFRKPSTLEQFMELGPKVRSLLLVNKPAGID
jgi:CheY-like chemotaxis protein